MEFLSTKLVQKMHRFTAKTSNPTRVERRHVSRTVPQFVADTRGAAFVQYLGIVVALALAAAAGFVRLTASFEETATAQEGALAAFFAGDGVDYKDCPECDLPPPPEDIPEPVGNGLVRDQAFGGNGGSPFDCSTGITADSRVTSVSVRTGNRVDQIGVGYSDGTACTNGGGGGKGYTLELGEGEYIQKVEFSVRDGRLHSILITTNLGRTVGGGRVRDEQYTFEAAAGQQIVSFHGRTGDEVDGLGVVYAPAPAT